MTLWTIQRFSYTWRADGNHRDLKLEDTWQHCRIKLWYEMEDIYFTATTEDGTLLADRVGTGYCGHAFITTRRRWIEWPADASYILCTLEAGI